MGIKIIYIIKMNIKLKEFKEKQKIKLEEFKEKQKIKLEEFKQKQKKIKIKGGVKTNFDIYYDFFVEYIIASNILDNNDDNYMKKKLIEFNNIPMSNEYKVHLLSLLNESDKIKLLNIDNYIEYIKDLYILIYINLFINTYTISELSNINISQIEMICSTLKDRINYICNPDIKKNILQIFKNLSNIDPSAPTYRPVPSAPTYRPPNPSAPTYRPDPSAPT